MLRICLADTWTALADTPNVEVEVLPDAPPYPCPFLTDEEIHTYLTTLYARCWTVQPSISAEKPKAAPELVKTFSFSSSQALDDFLRRIEDITRSENVSLTSFPLLHRPRNTHCTSPPLAPRRPGRVHRFTVGRHQGAHSLRPTSSVAPRGETKRTSPAWHHSARRPLRVLGGACAR